MATRNHPPQAKNILLEKVRFDRRMSKRELANKSGVDTCFISYAENRNFLLYDSQLEKLAKALDFDGDPQDLLMEV